MQKKALRILFIIICLSNHLPVLPAQAWSKQITGAAHALADRSSAPMAGVMTRAQVVDEQDAPPQTVYLPLIVTGTTHEAPVLQAETAESDNLVAQIQDPSAESQPALLDRPLTEWQAPLGPPRSEEVLVAYNPQTGEEREIRLTGVVPAFAAAHPGRADDAFADSAVTSTGRSLTAPTTLGSFSRAGIDPQTFPWRAIVKLSVTFNGSNYHCNGALIDPKFVLTSGACVYDHARGGWAQNINVYPAYNNGPSLWGVATDINLYSITGWTQDQNLTRNWGLIEVDRPIGTVTGWLGWGYNPTDAFYNRTANNPAYIDQNFLYNRSGLFNAIETEAFIHDGPWVNNAFGSIAYFTHDNSGRYVHGVASFTRNNNTQTGFTRMIKAIFDIFDQNINSRTPSQPDLIPLFVQTSSTVNAGEQIGAMTYRLLNYSSATYNGTVNVKTYLSTNDIISTNDTPIESHTVQPSGGLGPKGDTNVTVTSPPKIPLETPGGTYWIGVIVENADASTGNNIATGWDAARITVNPAPPRLRVSPNRLNFTATDGGPAPASQLISINNSGFGSFNWSASANQSWLVLQPTTGVNGAQLNVSINMLALPPNLLIHNGEITINAPGTIEGSARLPVNLTLTPPGLTVNPTQVTFQHILGQAAPASKAVALTVVGVQTLNWNATSDSSWLKVAPATGTGSGVINISVDPTGLRVDTYTGKILLSAANAAESRIDVRLTVVPGVPELQLSPATVEITAIEGSNPSAKAIAIQSTVDYPFNWLATTEAPWVVNRRGAGHTPELFVLSLETSALTPGEYTSALLVTSPDNPGQQWTAPIKLTVQPKGSAQPIMRIGPPSLTFSAVAGGANPTNQFLLIENVGQGTLQWNATTDVNWLDLSPSNGANGGQLNVAAAINQLPAGIHRGQITINAGPAGVQVVTVLLLIDQPSALAIDGTHLVFSGLTGQPDPPAERFTIRNAGDGNITWEATENLSWLSLDLSNGAAPATVQAAVTSNGLGVGVYTGNIDVRSNAVVNPQQAISTKFLLRRGPTLGTYPHALRFDAIKGESNPPGAELEIQNVGRGDLSWRAASSAPWLALTEMQGIVATAGRKMLQVTVQAGALEPRDAPYTGQIIVQTDNGEGGPQTIDVALTVASKARYCRIPVGGGDYIVNTSYVKLRLENVQRTFTADGGCDLNAQLRASLPQNGNITANLDGHVDANNNFIPIASSPLILKIAYFELQLADKFSISDQFGIQAAGGTWKMPVDFGSSNQQFSGQIQIGPKGLSIAGQSDFTMPDLKWGETTMYNLKGRVRFSTDGAYVIDLTGELRVGVKKSPNAVAKGLQISIDQRGIRSGKVGYFEVKEFAGMTLKVSEAVIEGNMLRAQHTYLAVPKLWGGSEVSLYGLTIHKSGDVTITGARFKLPSINAGGDDLKLTSLEGSLITLPGGGYEIFAKGVFGLKGLESVGDCQLLVAVTIQTGVFGGSVLNIASLNTQQPLLTQTTTPLPSVIQTVRSTDDLFLKELTVGLRDCQPGVALGPTGFFLTGVEGTITLETPTRVEKVQLTVWIESGAKIGKVPVISAVPKMTIYPDPFKALFDGPTYFLRMKTNETHVEITPQAFKTKVIYDYKVLHAGFAVEAGLNQARQFYVQGDGWANVGVKKGEVGKVCDPTGLAGAITGESCIRIPDRDYNLAAAEAHIDLDGVEGSVKIVGGYRAGFHFSFHDGSISFNLASLLQSVTSTQVAQARQVWVAHQRGEAVAAALDPRYQFREDGAVHITLPIQDATPTITASAVITSKPYPIALQRDVLFALLQPPTGLLTLSLVDPANQEIRLTNLPPGISFEQTHGITLTQSTFSVRQATPGIWQAVVEGDTQGTPFFLAQFANTPPPLFTAFSTERINDTEIAVNWRLLATEPNTIINLYATSGVITETVTVSNLQGTVTREEIYLFAGTRLADELPSAINGDPQTKVLNLSQLASESYALWLEAIGPQGGRIRCYLTDGAPACTKPDVTTAAPLRIQLNHPFPDSWSPTVITSVDSKNGQIRLSWAESAHPDLNTYAVHIWHVDPLAPTNVLSEEIPIAPTGNGVVNAVVNNLEPGHTYTFAVGAGNRHSGRMVWSAEQSFTTPQPDFILAPQVNGVSAASVEGLTVAAGGNTLEVPLGIDLSSNLPYPVELYVDFTQLADGIYVEFDTTAVAASVTEGRSVAKITATSTTPPGHYLIPIVARSGELVRHLPLNIEVLPTGGRLYLPVVVK
jgi:V8-like Glu-specific endopeptidase